jgi:hypothetical protein
VFCIFALCIIDFTDAWFWIVVITIPVSLIIVWAIHLPPADGEGIANNPGNF